MLKGGSKFRSRGGLFAAFWVVALAAGLAVYGLISADDAAPSISHASVSPVAGATTAPAEAWLLDPYQDIDRDIEHPVGNIRGGVFGSNGEPVSGARVMADPATVQPDFPAYETRTDPAGIFTLKGLSAGRSYHVMVETEFGVEQTFADVGDDLRFVFALPNPATHAAVSGTGVVFGQVTDEFGVPVRGYPVFMVPAVNPGDRLTQQDAEGRTQRVAGPNPAFARSGHPSADRQPPDGNSQGIPADEEIQELVRILESVRDLDQIQQGMLDESEVPPERIRSGRSQRRAFRDGLTARTDENGMYRIEGVPVGSHLVLTGIGPNSTSVHVEAGAEHRVDLTAVSEARLHIFHQDPDGQEAGRVSVQLRNESGQRVNALPMPTDVPGMAKFVGIPPGRYVIELRPAEYAHVTQEIILSAGVNRLDVKWERAAVINATITNERITMPGTLVATVTNDAGLSHTARIGARTSQFQFRHLQSGSWTLSITDTTGNAFYEQRHWFEPGESNLEIEIVSRASLNMHFTLAEPADNASVSVRINAEGTRRTRNASFPVSANRDTYNFEFRYLQPGETYTVTAQIRNGYQTSRSITLHAGTNDLRLSLGPPNAVRVTSVAQGTQAERVGIQAEDIIFSYNGVNVNNQRELTQAINDATSQGITSITLGVDRNGAVYYFTIEPGRIGVNVADTRR